MAASAVLQSSFPQRKSISTVPGTQTALWTGKSLEDSTPRKSPVSHGIPWQVKNADFDILLNFFKQMICTFF